MRKWEDIVRDKLEAFERPLPEGSLARFNTRRENGDSSRDAKRFPIVWVAAAAIAAGLAALLFLHRPGATEDSVQIIQSANLTAISDSSDVKETVQPASLMALAQTTKTTGLKQLRAQESTILDNPDYEETIISRDTTDEAPISIAEIIDVPSTVDEAFGEKSDTEIASDVTSGAPEVKTPNLDVVHAIAGVAGRSADALLLSLAPSLLSTKDYGTDMYPGMEVLKRSKHYMPIRTGLSVSIPISERLFISSGINYSLYLSRYEYTISGKQERLKNQSAHYLGIPLRLDGILATNGWLSVYLGGGIEGDYCIRAMRDGASLKKDGFGLSILGAGGVQFNLTKYMGIYLEPQLSWRIPFGTGVSTYRTEYPLMFSVNSGIRFTIYANE